MIAFDCDVILFSISLFPSVVHAFDACLWLSGSSCFRSLLLCGLTFPAQPDSLATCANNGKSSEMMKYVKRQRELQLIACAHLLCCGFGHQSASKAEMLLLTAWIEGEGRRKMWRDKRQVQRGRDKAAEAERRTEKEAERQRERERDTHTHIKCNVIHNKQGGKMNKGMNI